MKLVLKLPKDKLPFIGVQFNSNYQAGRTNSDLLHHHEHLFKIQLEPDKKGTIKLKLYCEDLAISRIYEGIEYDQYQLKNWMYMVSRSKQFNFGHVTMEENKHIISKDSAFRIFVIKLDKVELVEEM